LIHIGEFGFVGKRGKNRKYQEKARYNSLIDFISILTQSFTFKKIDERVINEIPIKFTLILLLGKTLVKPTSPTSTIQKQVCCSYIGVHQNPDRIFLLTYKWFSITFGAFPAV
jgi:hypothetical protein